jgi:NadR type nicotinamide-nucleotide adenylyltransferase
VDRRGQAAAGLGVIRVCFHGAESTGKSVLARQLHERFGYPWVPEYGRQYCEERGTDLTMDDLLAIAEGQDAAMASAMEADPPLLVLDTDPLMTAAWAQMLFGEIPDELFAYDKAELYMLFAPDVPWVADGTRFFGTDDERARFAQVSADVLKRAGVEHVEISGGWYERRALVTEAIDRLLG